MIKKIIIYAQHFLKILILKMTKCIIIMKLIEVDTLIHARMNNLQYF